MSRAAFKLDVVDEIYNCWRSSWLELRQLFSVLFHLETGLAVTSDFSRRARCYNV